jgi:hypothetical protein
MPEIWGIIITALLSAAVGAIGGNWAVNHKTATKTEVSYLREIIEEFRKERECDREEIANLTEEVNELRAFMEEKGLTPPPRKPRRKQIDCSQK